MKHWTIVAALLLIARPATAQQVVSFAWDPVADADGYVLYAGPTPGSEATAIPSTTTTASATFQPGTYYAHVRAYISTGFSGPSNEVTFTVASAPPPPPPSDPCVADPLVVTVTTWPTRKIKPIYLSNYPIATYTYALRGQTVTAITWTDTRGCVLVTPHP